MPIDNRPLNAFKYKAFSPKAPQHETHVSAVRRQAQANARFSRPDEVSWRPQGALGAARQGPRAPYALISAAAPRGIRRFRLTGRGAFEALFRQGRRRDGEYLQLIAVPAARPPGRVGFVIGKRALPLAVDRNRVRRMLRETLRGARPAIEGYDVIFRLKRGCPRAEFARVVAEATQLVVTLVAGGSLR
jgi:ribonuclease P protein component